jgi:hypothetical protein
MATTRKLTSASRRQLARYGFMQTGASTEKKDKAVSESSINRLKPLRLRRAVIAYNLKEFV